MTNDVLSEQIRGLTTLMNAQFINVHDRFNKIDVKIEKHDEQITASLIERAGIQIELTKLKTSDEDNAKKLEDVFWAFRYPKLTLTGIAVFVLLTFGTITGIYASYKKDITGLKKDNVELIQSQKNIQNTQSQVKVDLGIQEKEVKTALDKATK